MESSDNERTPRGTSKRHISFENVSKEKDENGNDPPVRQRTRDRLVPVKKEIIRHSMSTPEDVYATPRKVKRPTTLSKQNTFDEREKTSPDNHGKSPSLRHWKAVDDLRDAEFNFMDSPIEEQKINEHLHSQNEIHYSNVINYNQKKPNSNRKIPQSDFNFMDSPIETYDEVISNDFLLSNGYIYSPHEPPLSTDTNIRNLHQDKDKLKNVPKKPDRKNKPKSKPELQRQSSALGRIYLPPPMYGQINPSFEPDPDYSLYSDIISEPMVYIPRPDYPVYAGYNSYDAINGSLV